MPRGGKRPGAGRKPGTRRSGGPGVTVLFGVQQDPATGKFFFFVDTERNRVAHRSKRLYDERDEAAFAAVEWLSKHGGRA